MHRNILCLGGYCDEAHGPAEHWVFPKRVGGWEQQLIALGGCTPTEIRTVLCWQVPEQCWGHPTRSLPHFQRSYEQQISCRFLCFVIPFFFSSVILFKISRSGGWEERKTPIQVPTKKGFQVLELWKLHNQVMWIHSCPLKLYLNLHKLVTWNTYEQSNAPSGQRESSGPCSPCSGQSAGLLSTHLAGLVRPSQAGLVEDRGRALPAWLGGAASTSPLPGAAGKPGRLSADVTWGQDPHTLWKPGHLSPFTHGFRTWVPSSSSAQNPIQTWTRRWGPHPFYSDTHLAARTLKALLLTVSTRIWDSRSHTGDQYIITKELGRSGPKP